MELNLEPTVFQTGELTTTAILLNSWAYAYAAFAKILLVTTSTQYKHQLASDGSTQLLL